MEQVPAAGGRGPEEVWVEAADADPEEGRAPDPAATVCARAAEQKLPTGREFPVLR